MSSSGLLDNPEDLKHSVLMRVVNQIVKNSIDQIYGDEDNLTLGGGHNTQIMYHRNAHLKPTQSY